MRHITWRRFTNDGPCNTTLVLLDGGRHDRSGEQVLNNNFLPDRIAAKNNYGEQGSGKGAKTSFLHNDSPFNSNRKNVKPNWGYLKTCATIVHVHSAKKQIQQPTSPW